MIWFWLSLWRSGMQRKSDLENCGAGYAQLRI